MDHRGHLVEVESEEQVAELKKKGYSEVPRRLRRQAKLELMGNKEIFVGMTSSGSMSKHARRLLKAKLRAERKELI